MTTYLRFNDLVARGILRNRTTLSRWQKQLGFPAGVLIGPNTRAWTAESIEKWCTERATQSTPGAA
jgi:predicted DNA-binding transcriptional regulator AlpA